MERKKIKNKDERGEESCGREGSQGVDSFTKGRGLPDGRNCKVSVGT